MHSQHRRRQIVLLPLAAGLSALGTCLARGAESYPSKPIRMVVPFPAGGPTDIVARPFGLLLGNALKQSVVIDNRGGAGGLIGAAAVATSASDGYTLLVGTVGTQAINPYLYKKLSYNPQKDLTPLASIASAPVAIVVNPTSGITSLGELISQAKAKPGSINYGSAGNGTPGHLTAAMFCTAAGIRLAHVPYKGSAPAVTEVIGGQIPVMFDPLQSVLPHVQSGKLKVLAGYQPAAFARIARDAHRCRTRLPRLRSHRVVGAVRRRRPRRHRGKTTDCADAAHCSVHRLQQQDQQPRAAPPERPARKFPAV